MSNNDSETARIFADLAEVVLTAAREIHLHENELPETAVALTASNAQVMRHIDAHPGATAREAAELTGLRRSNLSTALRELERIGFIERRPDENDKRGVRVFPTPAAAHARSVVRAQWADEVERMVGDVDGAIAATALLRKLASGLAAERIESSRADVRRQLRRPPRPADAAADPPPPDSMDDPIPSPEAADQDREGEP